MTLFTNHPHSLISKLHIPQRKSKPGSDTKSVTPPNIHQSLIAFLSLVFPIRNNDENDQALLPSNKDKALLVHDKLVHNNQCLP